MVHAEERLALIECFERDGRAGRTVDVHAWPLTLGRALSNRMVLDLSLIHISEPTRPY